MIESIRNKIEPTEREIGNGNPKEPKAEARKKEGEETRGRLTERDVQACQWACEQGVMTVDQFWRAIWWSTESKGPRYAYERILFLERTRFLEKIRTPYNLKTYFKGTRMTQELVNERGEGVTLTPLVTPRLNEIPHADGLTELRITALRAGKCRRWTPDRVLLLDPQFPKERFQSLVPDALWVTPSGKKIAVEFERTRKGAARLRPKIETFSRELARPDRVMDFVLWIAAPGAHGDLHRLLTTHPNQRLRTFDQLLAELKTPLTGETSFSERKEKS